jgi:hypothetical protein
MCGGAKYESQGERYPSLHRESSLSVRMSY